MKYRPGDDVLVKFDGIIHSGEIVSHDRGWVTAILATDPDADYGGITTWLSPRSLVCVREAFVKPAGEGFGSDGEVVEDWHGKCKPGG